MSAQIVRKIHAAISFNIREQNHDGEQTDGQKGWIQYTLGLNYG